MCVSDFPRKIMHFGSSESIYTLKAAVKTIYFVEFTNKAKVFSKEKTNSAEITYDNDE